MTEIRGRFVISNRLGLHARAATALAQLAGQFDARVELLKDGHRARSTSVIELLLLCGQPGSIVEVVAQGPQASEALSAIGGLIAQRFGEPQ